MGRGGPRSGSGRKASPATAAIRSVVNNPRAIKAIRERALADPVFWFQLYQQIHGRPAQALTVGGPDDGPVPVALTFRFVAGVGKDGNPADD